MLVTSKWLNENLNTPNLKILDCSWHMPDEGRNAGLEFNDCHIEGSQYFDLDFNSDPKSALPHMMPSEEVFSKNMSNLGLHNDDTIICYDNSSVHSSFRAWWMFKAFGIKNVFILDGGLQGWQENGYKISNNPDKPNVGNFKAILDKTLIFNLNNVKEEISSNRYSILDARSPERFYGKVPEPRPGLRSGHIPGSINLYYQSFFKNGYLKSIKELKKLFKEKNIDMGKPVITSCGSGVTACILTFALEQIGKKDVKLYDGSWVEWGSTDNVPIEKN